MRGQRKIKLSFIAVVAVSFVALTVLGWQVNSNRSLAKQGRQARVALCALKNDLARRVTDSRQFLREHPEGIPGITAKTIQVSIRNQESTLRALKQLSCPPPATEPPSILK